MGDKEINLPDYINFAYNRFLMTRVEYLIFTQNEQESKVLRIIEWCIDSERERLYIKAKAKTPPGEEVKIPDIVWVPISHNFFMSQLQGTIQSETTLKETLLSLEKKYLIFEREGGSGPYDPNLFTINKHRMATLTTLLPPMLDQLDMIAIMKQPRTVKKVREGQLMTPSKIDPLVKRIRGAINDPLDPQLLTLYSPIIDPLSRSRGGQKLPPKRYIDTTKDDSKESIGDDAIAHHATPSPSNHNDACTSTGDDTEHAFSYSPSTTGTDALITLSGSLSDGYTLAPIQIRVQEDEGEYIASCPHTHIHGTGPTRDDAISAFKRIILGEYLLLGKDEAELSTHLQQELAYLRSIITCGNDALLENNSENHSHEEIDTNADHGFMADGAAGVVGAGRSAGVQARSRSGQAQGATHTASPDALGGSRNAGDACGEGVTPHQGSVQTDATPSSSVGNPEGEGKKPARTRRKADDEGKKPVAPFMMPPEEMAWGTTKCLQMFRAWRGKDLIGTYKLSQASSCAKGLAAQYTEAEVIEVRTAMNNDPYWESRGGPDVCDVASNIHKEINKLRRKSSQRTVAAASGPHPVIRSSVPTAADLRAPVW